MNRLGQILNGAGIPARLANVAPHLDPIPLGETAEDAAERQERANRKRHEVFERTVPDEFVDASLDDLEPTVRGQLEAWLTSRSRTVVISGNVGVGKSHAAFALARRAVERGFDAAAWTVSDLMNDLYDSPEARTRSRTVGILVLDDLGAETAKEWRVEQMTALLDARVREGRKQVVTTNLNYADLAEKYGDRTMSRLTGGAVILELVGQDRRRVTW